VSASAVPGRPAVIRLDPADNVLVATGVLAPGTVVDVPGGGTQLVVREPIPAGHKLAAIDLPVGAPVLKYGEPIGVTRREVGAGSHVHTDAVRFVAGEELAGLRLPGGQRRGGPPGASPRRVDGASLGFLGYHRPDGRVGTRNEILVMVSVNCAATVARRIAARFATPEAMAALPGVDGVVALTHGTGCGLDATGEGLAILRRTLVGYARHPNVIGVCLVGLGCEVNQVDLLLGEEDLDGVPLRAVGIQEAGGTQAAIAAGVAAIEELAESASAAGRTWAPAAELVLGLNCGGSDAWSGVSANPALGSAVDRLVAAGGTAVLAETPEIYGAEHLLLARAASPEVAGALTERLAWWEGYLAQSGGSMDHNPSPGNKAGGITTVVEKSLGAVAKGGSSPLQAVYRYAEPVRAKGLVFMDTPGFDPVSVTGIVAGGAQVICFTTGRGSVFGCKPAPSLKLATTRAIYERMPDDMDIDCGAILEGECTVEEMGEEILSAVLDVASGRPTKSELHGMGDEEFVPWQLGAVM